jgi:hypothetical protein
MPPAKPPTPGNAPPRRLWSPTPGSALGANN